MVTAGRNYRISQLRTTPQTLSRRRSRSGAAEQADQEPGDAVEQGAVDDQDENRHPVERHGGGVEADNARGKEGGIGGDEAKQIGRRMAAGEQLQPGVAQPDPRKDQRPYNEIRAPQTGRRTDE